jgi:putative transposase
MIEENQDVISVRRQCELLGVARSNIYYTATKNQQDTVLANEIHDIWRKMPFYGYRRITAELHRRNYEINHKKVRRLMKEMGIEALYPRPKTSIKSLGNKIFPYLLHGLMVFNINEVWATDITYIKLPSGFVYLMALIDWSSRYILSWKISSCMDISFCLETLNSALEKATPSIINTDQGSQFTSQEWVETVQKSGAKVSMDGKGRWADNIIIERFWRTVKHEFLRYVMPETLPELRREVGAFIKLYNEERLHQSLNYQTPQEVYYGQAIKIVA